MRLSISSPISHIKRKLRHASPTEYALDTENNVKQKTEKFFTDYFEEHPLSKSDIRELMAKLDPENDNEALL